jgi:hypothetical protein
VVTQLHLAHAFQQIARLVLSNKRESILTAQIY